MNRVEVVRCPCGHPVCRTYSTDDGQFYQGNGWDEETARRHALSVNLLSGVTLEQLAYLDSCSTEDNRITAERAMEALTLRGSVWEAMRIMGYDTDGADHHHVRGDLGQILIEFAKEFRQQYDESLRHMPGPSEKE